MCSVLGWLVYAELERFLSLIVFYFFLRLILPKIIFYFQLNFNLPDRHTNILLTSSFYSYFSWLGSI